MIDEIKYSYISDNYKLIELIEDIKRSSIIALDTEFSRSETYYPVLSIIQVAVKINNEKKIFIIDCLCDLDLGEFLALIGDEKIIKILHSSLQDLQIFYLKYPIEPKAIIDTQILANFCGCGANVGYGNLVEKIFEVVIDSIKRTLSLPVNGDIAQGILKLLLLVCISKSQFGIILV